jgi:hypothetical protein
VVSSRTQCRSSADEGVLEEAEGGSEDVGRARCLVVQCLSMVAAVTTGTILLAAQSPRHPVMPFEQYVGLSHPVPYVLRLSRPQGSLLYFGAEHTFDSAHAQLDRIEEVWNAFRPDVAFFEGRDPDSMSSVRAPTTRAQAVTESSMVVFLATRDHVVLRTLEPRRKDEVVMLLERYTPEQVTIFYVLRQIPQYFASHDPQPLALYVNNMLGGLATVFGNVNGPRDLAAFEAAIKRVLPALNDWREVPQAWFDPAPSIAPTFLNAISRLLSEMRDQHMVDVLEEAVTGRHRVFAVAGASHVVMQEPALRVDLK